MNRGTETTVIAQAAGMFDSTESSRNQQVSDDLLRNGFTRQQAEAIIRSVETHSATKPPTCEPTATSSGNRQELFIHLFGGLTPIVVLLTIMLFVLFFGHFALS